MHDGIVIIYTSEIAKENQSVDSNTKSAFGYKIVSDEEDILFAKGVYGRTNNQMELVAAIVALEKAVSLDFNLRRTIIYSDSEYLIKGATGENKRHKNLDYWTILDGLIALFPKLDFKKVDAHAGKLDENGKNNQEIADLVRKTIKELPDADNLKYNRIRL